MPAETKFELKMGAATREAFGRALVELGLSADELASVRWKNAQRIFPPGSFPLLEGRDA